MSTMDATARMSRTFAGDTSTLGVARDAAVAFLADHDLPSTATDWAQLVVSELATNAVQSAPGSDYTVGVQVTGDRSLASISVVSVGSPDDFPDPFSTRPVDAAGRLVMSGRGLAIVQTLSETVTVDGLADGTVSVCATLRLR